MKVSEALAQVNNLAKDMPASIDEAFQKKVDALCTDIIKNAPSLTEDVSYNVLISALDSLRGKVAKQLSKGESGLIGSAKTIQKINITLAKIAGLPHHSASKSLGSPPHARGKVEQEEAELGSSASSLHASGKAEREEEEPGSSVGQAAGAVPSNNINRKIAEQIRPFFYDLEIRKALDALNAKLPEGTPKHQWNQNVVRSVCENILKDPDLPKGKCALFRSSTTIPDGFVMTFSQEKPSAHSSFVTEKVIKNVAFKIEDGKVQQYVSKGNPTGKPYDSLEKFMGSVGLRFEDFLSVSQASQTINAYVRNAYS